MWSIGSRALLTGGSVIINIIAPSGRRPRASTDDYQVCVIVVTIRRWVDVGLWRAVCVLAKISFRRPRTTFSSLTQSQAISQSTAFSSQYQINERHKKVSLSFIYRNSFIHHYCFFYHGDQQISWWRICRWRAGNFENHPCSPVVNSDLRECFFWGLCKPMIASTDLWPPEMFTFFEMLAMVVSESSFGACVCHGRPVGLHRHQRACHRSTAISPLYKLIWPLHVRIRGNWAESVSTLLKNRAIVRSLGDTGTKMASSFCWDFQLSNEGSFVEIVQEMTKLGWKVWKKSLQSLRAELQSLRAESIAVCMQRWSFRRRSLSWETSFDWSEMKVRALPGVSPHPAVRTWPGFQIKWT